jgi:hypothetical protein
LVCISSGWGVSQWLKSRLLDEETEFQICFEPPTDTATTPDLVVEVDAEGNQSESKSQDRRE